MIDTLVEALPRAQEINAPERQALSRGEYVVVTLHRPSNVDKPETLCRLLAALETLSRDRPVVFPVHPRTRERIERLGFVAGNNSQLRLVEPVSYLHMLSLTASAGLVVTDSGGLQEETSFLGIPCVTVRPNTERPELLGDPVCHRAAEHRTADHLHQWNQPAGTTRP
jgi:UDP-N-acetylglucosamine 2-epimerase (non-hydrolysing)